MAVYTKVSRDALEAFLQDYDIGALEDFEGILAGVSNTNYFVTAGESRYVLTLFESRRVEAEDVPFFVTYTEALRAAGVQCPEPVRKRDGEAVSNLNGRPAVIFTLLDGEGATVSSLDVRRCEQAGAQLADMHLAARGVEETRPNRFAQERWRTWIGTMSERLNDIAPGLFHLVGEEYDWVVYRWPKEIERGAIHADYFPDNVFFKDGDLTGVIDFHFACTEFLAYDLAIALTAWSFDASNAYRDEWMDAFLRGYNAVRLLTTEENRDLPHLLRAACLRFILSRAEETLNHREGDMMTPHDPGVYIARLRHFQSVSP